MKPIPTQILRTVTSVLLAIVCLTLVSCNKPDLWPFADDKPSLEECYTELQARFETSEARAEKATDAVTIWQGVAALFVVLAGFALVYGAALGSQARRLQSATPEETDHEIAL